MKNEGSQSSMTASTLAKHAGVGIESIRFYERKGLLPRPTRSQSGYRQYGGEDARRVRFIKRAQALGFTLNEIKELLALRINSRAKCSDVKKRTDGKIAEIQAKVKDLRKMMRSLKNLSDACGCEDAPTSQCPILDCFEEEGSCPCPK
ncbi:MAG: heavy metal-responsive transcriptional regulator [Deltaproteobacteria bacterium]|nr:heavy metal-responsive transcriptional regulator [Deltaproteobacteria bacterium]